MGKVKKFNRLIILEFVLIFLDTKIMWTIKFNKS